MKNDRKKHWLLCLLLLLALCSVVWAGGSGARNEDDENTIAVKMSKNSVVVLANGLGKLTFGENDLCIVIRDPLTGRANDVREITADITLHRGKRLESPVRAQLTQQSVGRHCGQVNLGPKYYKPISVHIDVGYVDTDNRKQKVGFWFTVK